ncbi:ATP synthase F1 subunit epsilon [Mageeibacillus indolicus]|jgi:hypothetical protein|uniref:ATP synthase epsilon chain n=2 Tax=Mageeibacillus indolicus TaxID=884684 RepID=D3R2J6_MAGIU|nr:ATP synthase F1 subunit epsilon [Mageeibacillus indolicus]ADC91260.1 ATP synthase F1, epsilon subunit [Mageeibacillus indolicus UPII9-5]KFA57300.1 ATP synthase F1 subunit epsilon [Mageeibacillus indolicus 0009-5]PNH19881.1 ATP synthase F1 subunit epsilon [Mageeibacillus indolicus]
MNTFKVHILAADKTFYDGDCESLILPTINGQYGILAGHCNMISAVVPGKLTYRQPGGQNKLAAVSSGLVKVENNEVLVLVDSAERPEDIDIIKAKRAADNAKEALLQKQSIREYHTAQMALARAIARLRVKNSSGKVNN